MGIDTTCHKRSNISGALIPDDQIDGINVEVTLSLKEMTKGLFKKAGIFPCDEDTETRFIGLRTYLKSLISECEKRKIKEHKPNVNISMCSVTNIMSRLISKGAEMGKQHTEELSEGETILVSILQDKSIPLEQIAKYLPKRNVETIIKSLNSINTSKDMHHIKIGLPNLNNTCFIVSALQMLINNESLFHFIIKCASQKETLLSGLQDLIHEYQISHSNSEEIFRNFVNMSEHFILSINHQTPHTQNDSSEFFFTYCIN